MSKNAWSKDCRLLMSTLCRGVMVVFVFASLCTTVLSAESNPPTEKEYIDLAERAYAAYSEKLTPEEKIFVDEQLFKLNAIGVFKTQAVTDLTSNTCFLADAGFSPAVYVSLAAAAGKAIPSMALAAHNLGGMLRLAGNISESVEALKYARSLQPNSPLILTTLANSLFELGDDTAAESLYRDALKLDPDFSAAHQGLGTIYLKRKEPNKAIAEFFRAAQYSYAPSLRKGIETARGGGGTFVDLVIDSPDEDTSAGKEDSSQGQSSNKGMGLPPGDRLILPDFPKWESITNFVADPYVVSFNKQIMQEALIGVFAFGLQYHPEEVAKGLTEWSKGTGAPGEIQPPEIEEVPEQPQAENPHTETAPSHPLSNRALFELELLGYYFTDRIKPILDDRQSKAVPIMDKLGKELQSLEQAPPSDIRAAFKAPRDPVERMFAQWRDITLPAYAKERILLEEYWLYSDAILGHIYDLKSFEYAQKARRLVVHLALIPFAADFMQIPMAYCAGVLPDMFLSGSPPNLPEPASYEGLNVPNREKPDCLIGKGREMVIGFSTVDCESVEVEIGELVIVKLKHNYKNGETSIFTGVGGDVLVAGANAGVRVTSDKNGNLVDVSAESEIYIRKLSRENVFDSEKTTATVKGTELIETGMYVPIRTEIIGSTNIPVPWATIPGPLQILKAIPVK